MRRLERTGLCLYPFMGIDSTAVACVELGDDFEADQIDPDYCTKAREALDREAR